MITNEQIYQLNRTITEKAFDMESDVLFDRFCLLFEILTKEEVDLIIDLTQRYSEITLIQMDKLLKIAVQNLEKNPDFQRNNRLVIAPLHVLDAPDKKETKSSHMLYYLMKGLVARGGRPFNNKNISLVENSDAFLKAINSSSNVLWVDDFIGSGKTAYDLIINNTELISKVSSDRRFIIAMVCHEVGLDKLKPVLNEVCFGEMAVRGISSHSEYSEEKKQKYLRLMLGIEEKIGVEEDYSLGVGKCEGLISLIRTPNNTFPVYWLSRKRKKRRAPFER